MKLDRNRHRLFVEGTDDLFVVANLLERELAGIELDKFIQVPRASAGDDGAVGAAIRNFVSEVAIQKCERIGLIVDANGDAGKRRLEIRSALAKEGIEAGEDLSRFSTGGTGHVAGVWLMPDNTRSGSLEDFLFPLVEETALWAWAREATATARIEKAAPFTDESKAAFRAWLAWQKQPGLPPGEAVKRGLLATQRSAAFVTWFKGLFQEPNPQPGHSEMAT